MSSCDSTKGLYLACEAEITSISFTAKSQSQVMDATIGSDENVPHVQVAV